MNTDIISLDFYNNSFYIKLDDREYFTNSSDKFLSDINYPYSNTVGLLSYEPARNIYIVEYLGGDSELGTEIEPIKWFTDNMSHLLFVLANVEQTQAPVYTLEMERAVRFADTDWLMQRHQEQILLMTTPTLNNTQFASLLHYRQQLRDLTNTYPKETPANEVSWPTNPIN